MSDMTIETLSTMPPNNRMTHVLQGALQNERDGLPVNPLALIEILKYIHKLNCMENGTIPDYSAFHDLQLAFSRCDKIRMIKALREMFNTSLKETADEINRVFDAEKWRKLLNNHKPICIYALMQVKVWEFKGVKLGEMCGSAWVWN